MQSKIKKDLIKSGYRFVGPNQHSAVKICEWTKKSLAQDQPCFKQRWYGVESHRCCQCTASFFCLTRCVYCWRSFKAFLAKDMDPAKIDEPSEIIDGFIRAQRLLLSGFKGNPKVAKKKWKESQSPTNFAISLVGESILYPKISDLLQELHKKGCSSFLLTKGTSPERLKELETEPTNLYISLCAPDEETFKRIDRPIIPGAFERQMESLELMASFSCQKVIRLTAVRGLNMVRPASYGRLILRADPDFVEVKGYVHVGESRRRLPREAMPSMEEIEAFAKEIAESSSYRRRDSFGPSKVVLLSRK